MDDCDLLIYLQSYGQQIRNETLQGIVFGPFLRNFGSKFKPLLALRRHMTYDDHPIHPIHEPR